MLSKDEPFKACPFDDLPCANVDSCDDVMEFLFGLPMRFRCSRALVKASKEARPE